MIKIKVNELYGGYDVLNVISMGRGRKRRESVVASGFRDINKAVNYARLYAYDTKLLKKYDFTKTQKERLSQIKDMVYQAYCDWIGFVENVINDSMGLSGLLQRIDSNMAVQDIVNCYI